MGNAQSGNSFTLSVVTDSVINSGNNLPSFAMFSLIGGFRANNFEINCSVIDSTSKEDNEQMMILNNHGILTITTGGSGILKEESTFIQDTFLNQNLIWFSISRDDSRTYFFRGKISEYNTEGSYDGALLFTINITSSGSIFYQDEGGNSFNTGTDTITSFSNLLSNFDLIHGVREFPSSSIPSRSEVIANLDAFFPNIDESDLQNSDGNLNFAGVTPNTFSVPYFILKNSDLESRTLQVLDSLDEDLTRTGLVRVSDEKQDSMGNLYSIFFLDFQLANQESSDVTIQLG